MKLRPNTQKTKTASLVDQAGSLCTQIHLGLSIVPQPRDSANCALGTTLGIVVDTIFWLGLGLGALFSFPLSIAANLWTDKVRDVLDKRRKIRLSNKKSKEVRTYFFVRALIEGDPSARLTFDMDVGDSIRALVAVGIVCVIIGFVMVFSFDPRIGHYRIYLAWFGAACGIAGLICHITFAYLQLSLLQVKWKVRRFRQYEDSIREKWGDDALEEFSKLRQD